MTVVLELPFPPSINRLWRGGGKRVYRSAEYTDWLEESQWIVAAGRHKPILGNYEAYVLLHAPDRRRRDLDNFAFKAVFDLLVKTGLVQDDSHAKLIAATWVEEGPGVTVVLQKARENLDDLLRRTFGALQSGQNAPERP
jgi:hypothetical protein